MVDLKKTITKVVNKFRQYKHYIYPFLFAIFPLISFYGANINELKASEFNVWSFVLLSILIVILSWSISMILLRDFKKASVLSVVWILIFFMFGRLHSILSNFIIKIPIFNLGITKLLLICSLFLLIVIWRMVSKITEEQVIKINKVLTIVGVILILSAGAPVLLSVIFSKNDATSGDNKQVSTQQADAKAKPDVYYILLDGYARQDYLKANFNYDNSEFINGLKNKGFYVAEKSNANYAHTHLSVPSTLNMKYLNYLTAEIGENSNNIIPLRDLTQSTEVARKFKELGYKYIQIESQWQWTEKSKDSDIVIAETDPQKIIGVKLDEFAMVYLQTTALKPVISNYLTTGIATKILSAYKRTNKVPDYKESTYTFTHIDAPHPPYVFNKNGEVTNQKEFEMDAQGYSNRKGFVDQTVYINRLTNDLIDHILKSSEQPPIVILASDHGPASSLKRNDFEVTNTEEIDVNGVGERMANLNAYYFPDKKYDKLYPTITPVNTFRIILNQYFGQKYELLEDKSYFSDNKDNQYRMIDVTSLMK